MFILLSAVALVTMKLSTVYLTGECVYYIHLLSLWWLITVCLFDSCCRCCVIRWHGAWRPLYNTWCDALRCLPWSTLAAPSPAVSDTRTSTQNLLHMRRPCTRILCGRRGRLSGLYIIRCSMCVVLLYSVFYRLTTFVNIIIPSRSSVQMVHCSMNSSKCVISSTMYAVVPHMKI